MINAFAWLPQDECIAKATHVALSNCLSKGNERNIMFQKLGLVAFAATFAFVQIAQAEPANVRGEIVSFSADALTVKTREGETLNLALADG